MIAAVHKNDMLSKGKEKVPFPLTVFNGQAQKPQPAPPSLHLLDPVRTRLFVAVGCSLGGWKN